MPPEHYRSGKTYHKTTTTTAADTTSNDGNDESDTGKFLGTIELDDNLEDKDEESGLRQSKRSKKGQKAKRPYDKNLLFLQAKK